MVISWFRGIQKLAFLFFDHSLLFRYALSTKILVPVLPVTLVVQVTEAASSGDAESYDRLLHTLKGAADNLGFTTLSKTADALRTSIETSNQVTLLTVELEKAKNRYRKIAI